MTARLAAAAHVITAWLLNPRCPWCGERTGHIEQHMQREHAGDEL